VRHVRRMQTIELVPQLLELSTLHEVLYALARRPLVAATCFLCELVPAQELRHLLQQLLSEMDGVYPLFHVDAIRRGARSRPQGCVCIVSGSLSAMRVAEYSRSSFTSCLKIHSVHRTSYLELAF